MTDPIRAGGLTQGAKLELVVKSKTPTAVTVALRLPQSEAALGIPNNRVSAKVRSDTPLWKLLRHLEEANGAKQKGLNITARGVPRTSHTGSATGTAVAAAVGSGSGQLYWETPVLKFAGRELASLNDFRKTLSQVGIDAGSQLVMLEFRTSDTTLQEAMELVQTQLEIIEADAAVDQAAVSAPPAPASTTVPAPAPALAPASAPAETATTSDAAATEPAPKPTLEESTPEAKLSQPEPPAPTTTTTTTTTEPMEVDDGPRTFDVRPVQVWSPPKASAGMPAAASLRWGKEPESALAPSIAQMKAHQKQLEEAGRNKRLKSDSELEEETREREAKAAAVNRVDVRIRFPDGYTVMWSFANGATGATLHAAVRSVLATPVREQVFRLSPPMSREEIQDSEGAKHDLVRGYGMRGGVVVNFLRGADVPAPPAGQPYVKQDVAALAQDIVIPQATVDEEDEETAASSSRAPAAADGKRTNKGDGVNKMAKFLRLAKK